MNVYYCFTKPLTGVLIFADVSLAACSATTEPPAEAPVDLPPPAEAVIPEVSLEPTDPEVMNHVFAAELLGTEGDLSGAAAEYLVAAACRPAKTAGSAD